MRVSRLTLEHDGTKLLGGQRQPVGRTVQGILLTALREITDDPELAVGYPGEPAVLPPLEPVGVPASVHEVTGGAPRATRIGVPGSNR